ncbi:transmembrane protein, putative (macronuclear) [Tetrahymena thermophila SB210]|uniref:Transmembrane protein, putative n=1 Tax=Tetrahymena thermophila (strain SB210) TaxID=312017 RepID=W7XDA7_TETTS|nr:transmembrane protein, putative [Tetrahymena thermophila SB210]EWS74618.1 transmembrane protein, putative [Tetrahymena thermophila SB210]|eukprot:XP_012652840.1 transmembrane protein, putative [Tetrahymena thermophila SB210]
MTVFTYKSTFICYPIYERTYKSNFEYHVKLIYYKINQIIFILFLILKIFDVLIIQIGIQKYINLIGIARSFLSVFTSSSNQFLIKQKTKKNKQINLKSSSFEEQIIPTQNQTNKQINKQKNKKIKKSFEIKQKQQKHQQKMKTQANKPNKNIKQTNKQTSLKIKQHKKKQQNLYLGLAC